MSGSLTQYTTDKVLDHITGVAAFTAPTVYAGLSSTTPAVGGTGVTEPTGGSYARVAASGTGVWGAAAAGVSTNVSAITFPQASGTWASGANITYCVLYDAPTGGNFLGFGALSVPQPVVTGNTMIIPIAGATITIA